MCLLHNGACAPIAVSVCTWKTRPYELDRLLNGGVQQVRVVRRDADVDAMRAAAKELDTMIAAWGASEEELMKEYKEMGRVGREKKRKAK